MKFQLSIAVVAGAVVGASGIELAWAKAKPPAYMVVEYEITDHDGLEEFIKRDAAIHGARTFLARHAKGVSLSGALPKWIGIVQFPSVEEAVNFDTTSEFSALKPIRDKSTKWRSYVVGGMENQFGLVQTNQSATSICHDYWGARKLTLTAVACGSASTVGSHFTI